MHNTITSISVGDVKSFIIALIVGCIPALLWLFFWLKEDKENPEPRGLIALTFFGGMLAVMLAIPLQKLALSTGIDSTKLIPVWAGIEEILKYLVVFLIVLPTGYIDEPLDFAVFMITAGLGFAAFENTLFLLKPVSLSDSSVVLLLGHLRFLGSTLLHATASGIIGVTIGLAYFQSGFVRFLSTLIGILLAILLHSTFNFFIMKNEGQTTLQIFAFLWIVTSINILVFEKLRRMSGVRDTERETMYGKT